MALEDNLIAHWRFQNGSLEDSSGNGRHLTQVGTVAFVADKDGVANNAVSFEGLDNSLECAYSDVPENPYISAWVKCVTQNTDTEFLVVIRGIRGYWEGFALLLADGRVGWGTNINQETHTGQYDIADGNFHHCIVQYNKVKGRISLYVDKILRSQSTFGANVPITYADVNKIQLGAASNYPYESNDIIDEVRIGDRVLTGGTDVTGEIATGEIAELYDMGVNYSNDVNPPIPSFVGNSITDIGLYNCNLNLKTNINSTVYYLIASKGEENPTSQEIKAEKSGSFNLMAETYASKKITGLNENTDYDIFLVAENGIHLQAEPLKMQFRTLKSETPTSDKEDRVFLNLNRIYKKDEYLIALCNSLGLEMDIVENLTKKVYNNMFFDTIEEDLGIPIIAKTLNITVPSDLTLDNKRAYLSAKWKSKGKCSEELLQAIANSWRNGEVTIKFVNGIIKVTFASIAGVPSDLASLQHSINEVRPAHLLVDYVFNFLTWDRLKSWNITWDELKTKNLTWEQFKKQIIKP